MKTPSTRTGKRILLGAFVAGTLLCAALLFRPQSRPCVLAVQFVGFANHTTQTHAIFSVTNRGDTPIKFHAFCEAKLDGSWPIYPVGTVAPHTGPYTVGARHTYRLHSPVLDDGTPFRLSVVYSDPWTDWEQRRWGWSVWFEDHNLPVVGRLFSTGGPGHLVLSPEAHK